MAPPNNDLFYYLFDKGLSTSPDDQSTTIAGHTHQVIASRFSAVVTNVFNAALIIALNGDFFDVATSGGVHHEVSRFLLGAEVEYELRRGTIAGFGEIGSHHFLRILFTDGKDVVEFEAGAMAQREGYYITVVKAKDGNPAIVLRPEALPYMVLRMTILPAAISILACYAVVECFARWAIDVIHFKRLAASHSSV